MSKECSKAIKILSSSIKAMTIPSAADSHIYNAKTAANDLTMSLGTSQWQGNILEITPVATVASLLIEVICCTVKIEESVAELASLANFRPSDMAGQNSDDKMQSPSIESHNFSIQVE